MIQTQSLLQREGRHACLVYLGSADEDGTRSATSSGPERRTSQRKKSKEVEEEKEKSSKQVTIVQQLWGLAVAFVREVRTFPVQNTSSLNPHSHSLPDPATFRTMQQQRSTCFAIPLCAASSFLGAVPRPTVGAAASSTSALRANPRHARVAPSRRRQPPLAAAAASDSGGGGGAEEDAIDADALFLRGPVPGDRVVRTMSANGEVSVRVLACTGLVAGAARLHRTTPVAAAAFGRTLACALLLAAGKKDGETLQLEFRGDGPLRGVTAIANGDGEVRGYLGNPFVRIPPNAAGKLDVGRAVGRGILAVVRNSPFAKRPYTGLVSIVSGEIAEDVASYLADSEQTPSALGAGVYVSEEGLVTAAGGYLVQLLPGASDESIATVERNVTALPPPTELVRRGMSPDEICLAIMKDLNPLDLASSSPRYHCKCSVDRVKRTVALIPEIEVYDLLASQGKIEATCEFCGRRWELHRPQIEELFRAKNVQAATDAADTSTLPPEEGEIQ
jgi:molecular chaperone Hsp33